MISIRASIISVRAVQALGCHNALLNLTLFNPDHIVTAYMVDNISIIKSVVISVDHSIDLTFIMFIKMLWQSLHHLHNFTQLQLARFAFPSATSMDKKL